MRTVNLERNKRIGSAILALSALAAEAMPLSVVSADLTPPPFTGQMYQGRKGPDVSVSRTPQAPAQAPVIMPVARLEPPIGTAVVDSLLGTRDVTSWLEKSRVASQTRQEASMITNPVLRAATPLEFPQFKAKLFTSKDAGYWEPGLPIPGSLGENPAWTVPSWAISSKLTDQVNRIVNVELQRIFDDVTGAATLAL